MRRKSHSGFTLIELSIVLVIIGLLVGGVLVGRDLIRAAELRSVVTEYEKFQTLVYTFRNKYSAVPGDMTNATTFWGDKATGMWDCADAAIPDGNPGTCNGNGNGHVELWRESLRFWQHLSLAGIIEGGYEGIPNETYFFGRSVPASKLPNNGWWLYYFARSSHGWTGPDAAVSYTVFRFGGLLSDPPDQSRVATITLKPMDAYNIDKKADDGKPGFGKVYSLMHPDCQTTNDPATSEYNITDTGLKCMLEFVLK